MIPQLLTRGSVPALLLLATFGGSPLCAQVAVTDMTTSGTTAQSLANSLAGTGVTIVPGSASLIQTTESGAPASSAALVAAGSFLDSSSVLGFGSGVILSSGSATNIQGTPPTYNTTTSAGSALGLAGDPLLQSLYGDGDIQHEFYDSTTLQFSFVPTTSTVSFQYVFASEEYDEWVDRGFNDIFAAFFNGSRSNQASLGAQRQIVTVDSVNGHASRLLYVDNTASTYSTEADGFTKVLTCTATVTPNVTNTVKLIISDRGDANYDSWALLKAGSLTSTPPVTLAATATSGTSLPSTSNGYTITLTNTGTSAATVTKIQDLLPLGFTYTLGSSSGVSSSNPTSTTTSDGSKLLTWTGSYSVPASSSVTLSFNVTTSSAYGDFYNNVSGEGSVAVVPTGDTALIKVRHAQDIAVTGPNGDAQKTNVSTYDFGGFLSGATTTARTFTIKNEGVSASLTGIGVTVTGTNTTDFIVDTTGMSTSLATGQSTTFTVKFKPGATGGRSATLNIASSDTSKNPFKIGVYGTGETALTGSQLAYIKATNAQAGDSFGTVAMSGNTIVVGASGEDSASSGVNGDQSNDTVNSAGAVYVFVRDPATGAITQEAYLKASSPGADDSLGVVAISGDTIVAASYVEDSNATGVNAPLTGGSGTQADNSADEAGAAYVFVRNPATHTWTQQAYLKASNTERWDDYGYSVAVSGDTIAIGAPGESSNATGINGSQTNNLSPVSGAVYVYSRSGTTWTQQAYVKPNHVEDNQYFGLAVALDGSTLAVGAPGTSTGGAVEVFTRSGSTWSAQANLTASNANAGDSFGNAIAISGNSVVIGAPYESSNATGINASLTGGSGTQADNSKSASGAAYVFTRSGTTWTQQAYLKASNTDAGDNYGTSVAISANMIAIGAPGEGSNGTGINGTQTNNLIEKSGAAYVYIRTGTTTPVWAQYGYLKASNSGYYDQFAWLALDGDYLAVGAPGERSQSTGINGDQSDDSGNFTGAVYYFDLFQ